MFDDSQRQPVDSIFVNGDHLDIESHYGQIKPMRKHRFALRKLSIVVVMAFVFTVVEIIGGVMSDSMSVYADAADSLSDFTNFAIGITSIGFARLPASAKMTFGFNRIEVVGALISIFVIWIIELALVVESVNRIINPIEIDVLVMMIVGIFGLISNIGMGLILLVRDRARERDEISPSFLETSLLSENEKEEKYEYGVNIKAALTNVLGNIIQHIGVIIASTIIFLVPSAVIVDPICSIVFVIFVIITTIPVFKEGVHILLNFTPKNYSISDIIADLEAIDGVEDIHSVHLWAIS